MKLSNHFSLEEFIKTSVKADNTPNEEQVSNLQYLVDNVLEPLRIKFGRPIEISSGFRSKEVNKKVKGASTSQHTKGEAADIKGGSKELNEELFNIIKDLGKYDQLINEYDFSWVHVSYKKGKNRKQILVLK